MTIMVVAPSFSIHTKRFIDAILSKGHQVVGVCEKNPFPKGRNGLRFFMFPHLWGLPLRYIRGLMSVAMGFKTGDRITIWIAGLLMKCLWLWFRPDVVYVLWVDSMANVCLSAGLRPLVLQCWGSDINQHFLSEADPYLRELCGKALAGADLIIYDAPDMPEKLEKIAGQTVRATFLHFGVDTDFFSVRPLDIRTAWRERLNIPKDAIVLFSARAWHPKYRHHLILEAFSNALVKLSKQVFLVFKLYNGDNYSDFQQYEDTVRRRAEELGISDRVRWMNEVSYEQLPDLYAMSDILVNFPIMDSLGITLMEAASCKRRIISVALPCYKGTFVENYARIVSSGDIKDLEDAIVQAVNETPLDSVLEEARKEIERNFYHHMFSRKLEEINKNYCKSN